MPKLLLIFLGGGLGSLARYRLSMTIAEHFPSTIPMSTLVVNVLGSFLIGIFLALIAREQMGDLGRFLLVTGFCGGFTTFSTFSWENYQLFKQQDYLGLFAYTGLSIFWGFAAVLLGFWLVKNVF